MFASARTLHKVTESNIGSRNIPCRLSSCQRPLLHASSPDIYRAQRTARWNHGRFHGHIREIATVVRNNGPVAGVQFQHCTSCNKECGSCSSAVPCDCVLGARSSHVPPATSRTVAPSSFDRQAISRELSHPQQRSYVCIVQKATAVLTE